MYYDILIDLIPRGIPCNWLNSRRFPRGNSQLIPRGYFTWKNTNENFIVRNE